MGSYVTVRKALSDLKGIVKSAGVRYVKDSDGVCNRWHRSNLVFKRNYSNASSFDPICQVPESITVYADTSLQELVLLAHEVGHLKTTDFTNYQKYQVYYEELASNWAYDYLRHKVGLELAKSAKERVYNPCLDNYRCGIDSLNNPFPDLD